MKNSKNLKIKIFTESNYEKENYKRKLKLKTETLEKSLKEMKEEDKIRVFLNKIEEKMEEIYLDFLENSEN